MIFVPARIYNIKDTFNSEVNIMKKIYDVEVDCANCAAKMENEIKKLDGVNDAALSFMTLKLKVDFDEGADEKKIMKKALKACRKVESDCEIYF